ncbi:hypothetical protein [Actinokineospora sp. NBRC 105648]|uniref:hypothetical protein n=1 Tax=Actinokineospora sp. NBRC 105648 TaxID=3032206 RepID=UPI0024A1A3F9|nr:hypothetical protein [Actinokineospora sp. NBRC 105648]GLZ43498.1 hypothetical protein Acsp05_71220 [Actinokineospora sp. NBRC 105648]
MATWTDVINYVRTRYEVLDETDSWLRFRLDTVDDRTQQVAVHHVVADDGTWVEISSPVGWADKIDLRVLLERAGGSLVGGAAVVDGVALLKHSAPLEGLGVLEEFERPLRLIVARADDLEREFTSSDEF